MNSITNLSAQQLRRAAAIKDQIQSLENELHRIFGSPAKTALSIATKPKGKMSAAGRARIAAAQKARWAKLKGKNSTKPAPKKKFKMSAAAKAKISAAAKARWAKIRAAKK
jgi:hypothetical protein